MVRKQIMFRADVDDRPVLRMDEPAGRVLNRYVGAPSSTYSESTRLVSDTGSTSQLVNDTKVPYTRCRRFNGGYMYLWGFTSGSFFIMDLWFKVPTNITTRQAIAGTWKSATPQGYGLYIQNSNLYGILRSNIGSSYTVEHPLTGLSGTWLYAALFLSKSDNKFRLYIDSNLVSTTTVSGSLDTADWMHIAAEPGGANPFYGDVCGFRWNGHSSSTAKITTPWDIKNVMKCGYDLTKGFPIVTDHTVFLFNNDRIEPVSVSPVAQWSFSRRCRDFASGIKDESDQYSGTFNNLGDTDGPLNGTFTGGHTNTAKVVLNSLYSEFNITGDMSLSFWLAHTDSGVGTIIEYAASGETQDVNTPYKVYTNGSRRLMIRHEYGAGLDETITTDYVFPGGWDYHHIAIIRDVIAKTYTVYVDNTLIGAYGYTNNPDGGTSSAMRLYMYGDAEDTTSALYGRLADMRIYNQKITTGDITALYNQFKRVYDETGNHHGSLQVKWTGARRVTSHVGGSGVVIVESSDYIVIPNHSDFDAQNSLTVEMLIFCPGGTGTYRSIIVKYDPDKSWQRYPMMAIHSGDKVFCQVSDGSNSVYLEDPKVLEMAKFTHYAFTWDAVTYTFRMYKSGALIGSGSTVTMNLPNLNNSFPITIGGGWANMSSGLWIQSLRRVNYAMTPKEIYNNYKCANIRGRI